MEVDAIDLESYTEFGPGDTAYRIYVVVDEGDFLRTVFGGAATPLFVSCTTTFYQAAGGTDLVPWGSYSIELEFDTFVTIGASWDPDPVSGTDFTETSITFPGFGPSSLELNTADPGDAWYVFSDSYPQNQGSTWPGGRILLGQFTVLGGTGDPCLDLSGSLNMHGQYFWGGGWEEYYYDIWFDCSATATPTNTPTPIITPSPTSTPAAVVPAFSHLGILLLLASVTVVLAPELRRER